MAYNFWIGLAKAVKNSAIALIPVVAAILASVPTEYAWLAAPVSLFLKNLYDNYNN